MAEIPASLAPFFQEYDLQALDPDGAAWTIIERTPLAGTLPKTTRIVR